MTELTKPADLKIERQLALTEEKLLPAAFREPLRREAAPQRVTWRLALGLGLAALTISAASAYGRYYWTAGRFLESTDDAYVQADSTIVAPKVSGYLVDVLVADNQPVKAGQALAKIDDRDYVAALDQDKADVATAQADIETSRPRYCSSRPSSRRPAPPSRSTRPISPMRSRTTRATTPSPIAGPAACRMPSRRSRTRHRARLADARHGGGHGRRAAGRRAAGAARQGRCGLQHSQAVQEQAQLNLGYTNIVAPIDGVVGNRSLRVGQFVQAGTQLMAVVPLAAVYVVANFEETQLAGMHQGEPVGIVVDTYSARPSKAMSTALRRPAARNSRCCPPTTPPATSPRSCNASRSRSRSIRTIRCAAICGRACPSTQPSTPRRPSRPRWRPPRRGPRPCPETADTKAHDHGGIGCRRDPARHDRSGQLHDLGDGAGRAARRLHGGAEHPDHQRVAPLYRRRHRDRGRQRRLDLYRLSDRRDHRHSADRLSEPRVLVPTLSDRQPRFCFLGSRWPARSRTTSVR